MNHDAWIKHLRSTPREQWPAWVTTSQVTVVPFYDRTGLIYETLGTLNQALVEEILITIIVILVMVMHLRSSILISALLPLAVLMCFIAMKTFGVDANIVALSGIAIAIGTMVDMGIILCENILKHLDEASPEENRLEVIHRASTEVGGAVLTAVSTTIVSFLPVFTMIGAEGKLFKPLAFTKTFALAASVIVALTIIPPAAHILFTTKVSSRALKQVLYVGLIAAGVGIGIWLAWWAGLIVGALGVYKLVEESLPERQSHGRNACGPAARSWRGSGRALVGILLTDDWLPLGPEKGFLRNFAFVVSPDRRAAGLFSSVSEVSLQADSVVVLESQAAVSLRPGVDSGFGFRRLAWPQVRLRTHPAGIRRAVVVGQRKWPSCRRSSGSSTNWAACAAGRGKKCTISRWPRN